MASFFKKKKDGDKKPDSRGFEGTPDPTVHLQIMYKQKHVYKEYHNPENIHIRDIIDECLTNPELGCDSELTKDRAALYMHFSGSGITVMENSQKLKYYTPDISKDTFQFCQIAHKDTINPRESDSLQLGVQMK